MIANADASGAARAVEIAPLLDNGRWSRYQKAVLALVAFAVLFDGFDNQVLGFTIPLLIREWGVTKADFAPVFAIGFLGMAAGTLVGGMIGDRFGRKPTIIAAVLLFGLATLLSTMSGGLLTLGLYRMMAGIGLGAAMPNATAIIAEFTPAHRRSAAITLGIVCIPLGGVLGGLVAAQVLPMHGWRILFFGGGLAPMLLAAILMRWLPESPRILARAPEKAHALSALMGRLGHDPAIRYADTPEHVRGKARIADLFGPDYASDTIALWVAFFFCILATYIVFSWAPTLLTTTGYGIAVASTGLAVFNIGGVAGAVLGGITIQRFGSRFTMPAMAAIAISATGGLSLLPASVHDTLPLMVGLAIAGAAINGVQTTLYALAAQVYPAAIRATGVGATAAIGRLGAIVSSFVGALIVTGNAQYFVTIALTMAVVLTALTIMKRHISSA